MTPCLDEAPLPHPPRHTGRHAYTHAVPLSPLFLLALCLAPITPLRPLFIVPTYVWLGPVPVDLIDPEVFPMVVAARPCAASSSTWVSVCMCRSGWVGE